MPDLLREIHAVHEVLEARVRPQTIHPEVGPQEVRKVGRSLLVRFLQEFEGFVFVSQAGIGNPTIDCYTEPRRSYIVHQRHSAARVEACVMPRFRSLPCAAIELTRAKLNP